MSPFFKKLKNLAGSEGRPLTYPEEKPQEEILKEDPENKEPEKPRLLKKSQKKTPVGQTKKLIVGESLADFPKEPPKPIKEMKIQEKTEEKKWPASNASRSDAGWPEPEGQLAIDVYQTDGELVIQSTIAGVKPESLDVTAQGDKVVIRGSRENPETEEKNYFYQECYWGSFSREIILPVDADISRAEATMVEGVLTIRMPKIEKEKKKKITVK